MAETLRDLLRSGPVEVSAPCRVDMGGTLDISTFYHALGHLDPCTFNMAVDLRTRVRLLPGPPGRVKVSSLGFETAEFPSEVAPFDHPLGLMFAVAARFRADGVHIDIVSASPPRSALGGSSAAAVALVAAFSRARHRMDGTPVLPPAETALLAQSLEAGVAGVPCGLQDQLAAVFGGVHAWRWGRSTHVPAVEGEAVVPAGGYADLERRFLVAYCGEPHESKDVNGRWVRGFLSGGTRNAWVRIIGETRAFIRAVMAGDFAAAGAAMNRETALRLEMTPDVLDEMGKGLCADAAARGCGARFTGAGGGGCVWAVGEPEAVDRLREDWRERLRRRETGRLLDVGVDPDGLLEHEGPG